MLQNFQLPEEETAGDVAWNEISYLISNTNFGEVSLLENLFAQK